MTCCCQEMRRRFPTNYILLFAFTATEGFLVCVICSVYNLNSVLVVVLATAFLVGTLTLYAVTTKSDFTGMGVYLFSQHVRSSASSASFSCSSPLRLCEKPQKASIGFLGLCCGLPNKEKWTFLIGKATADPGKPALVFWGFVVSICPVCPRLMFRGL